MFLIELSYQKFQKLSALSSETKKVQGKINLYLLHHTEPRNSAQGRKVTHLIPEIIHKGERQISGRSKEHFSV